jgi:hypothetical protein
MLRVHPVVSTSIDVVAYDDDTGVLYLRFRDTKMLYAYYDVPTETVEELLASDSKGTYVNMKIKPRFRSRRVQKLPGTRQAS